MENYYAQINIPEIEEFLKLKSVFGKKIESEAAEKLTAELIKQKLGNIASLNEQLNQATLSEIMSWLEHFNDISLILERLSSGECLEIFELYEIKQYLYYYEKIRLITVSIHSAIINLQDFSGLFSYLDQEGQRTTSFYLSDNYSLILKRIRAEIADYSQKRKFLRLHALEQARIKLGLEKIEEEVVISRFNKALRDKLTISGLFNIEEENFANTTLKFAETEEILAISAKIHELLAQLKKEENAVREKISIYLNQFSDLLGESTVKLGELDYYLIRIAFLRKFNCSIPKISPDNKVQITNARNLPLELELTRSGLAYQPITLILDNRINIIQGANMAGKTTILKTLGQFFYLLLKVVPLPCTSCSLPLVDFIFFSGPGTDIKRMDLSSFALEVVSINEVLQKKGKGIFLIDEFARGTNPQEGTAFTKAIFESFSESQHILVAATHFSFKLNIGKYSRFRIKGISQQDYEKIRIEKDTLLQNRLKELHKYIDYSVEEISDECDPPQAALMIAEILGVDKKIITSALKYMKSNIISEEKCRN